MSERRWGGTVNTFDLRNGDTIPAIGFGTWKIAEGDETYGAVSEALNAGYRLIDTAAIYGNEVSVGKAIAESAVDRKGVFLTTKLWSDELGYDSGLAACRESLRRLGMDYVDLYLIHWPASSARLDAWRSLVALQAEGKAKHIGVSNFTVQHLEELKQVSDVVPEVNQIEFHPFVYDQQVEVLQYCHDNNIIVEAYSPLVQGDALKDQVVTKLAEDYSKTPAQILLRWAIEHQTIPIPKSQNPERILENLQVFDFELANKDVLLLDGLSNGTRVTSDPHKME